MVSSKLRKHWPFVGAVSLLIVVLAAGICLKVSRDNADKRAQLPADCKSLIQELMIDPNRWKISIHSEPELGRIEAEIEDVSGIDPPMFGYCALKDVAKTPDWLGDNDQWRFKVIRIGGRKIEHRTGGAILPKAAWGGKSAGWLEGDRYDQARQIIQAQREAAEARAAVAREEALRLSQLSIMPVEGEFSGTWSDASEATMESFTRRRIHGCGEMYEQRSLKSGRSVVYCTRDGYRWTAYLEGQRLAVLPSTIAPPY